MKWEAKGRGERQREWIGRDRTGGERVRGGGIGGKRRGRGA